MDKLLTKREVAKILGVSPKTVDRFRNLKTNRLKCVKVNGTVRFERFDVDDFIKKHKR
ncbi:MAG: DNA-binding protein [Planctomycetes bacterium]|nr:DNA-binding protein [Planctomycetota bacterium]